MRRAPLVLLLAGTTACAATPSSAPAPAPRPAQALDAETGAAEPAPEELPPAWNFLRAKYDANGDARIERGEYSRSDAGFFRLDADRDGAVTLADFDARFDGMPRTGDKTFVYGEGGPEVGDPAPDFELPTLDGAPLALASFRTKRPVVLVFGSFT